MTRALLAVFLVACSPAATQNALPRPTLIARADAADPIVATVDGRAITQSALVAEAAQAGGDRAQALAQALDRLLTAEALVSEAQRRGLDTSGEVTDGRAVALVQRLLADFERAHQKSDIPERELAAAYKSRERFFDHPNMADVWHILVPTSASPDSERPARRAIAERIAARAKNVHSLDDFKALAETEKQPDGQPLISQQVIADPVGVDPQFVEPALRLRNPGDVTGVVETAKFGYHIIYLKQRLPEQHLTLALAAPSLRDRMIVDFRARALVKFLDELKHQHHVESHPELLVNAP